MNQSINYAKLFNQFNHSKMEGNTYLLQNEIKEELMKLLKEYIWGALLTNTDMGVLCDHTQLFWINSVKIEMNDGFHSALKRLEIKLKKSNISAFDFMTDLNDLSQYDAFKEFDDDFTPFEKYCMTIAEFWLDELEKVQRQYLIDREKDAADLIASYYLESIYSPHTMLGRKRFDKERDALFN
tara:strand:+ start:423 stop:971 length:549 start_codon:yes stop_codon:yes gene_type:complete